MQSMRAPQTVYRVVRSDPPTEADFLSRQALGLPAPVASHLWDGVSVDDRVLAAERKARRFAQLGRYIATLRLPEDGSIRIEKTLANRNHYTLWGDPVTLLECVVELVPLEVRDVTGD